MSKLSRTSLKFSKSLETLRGKIYREIGAKLSNVQLQDVVATSLKGLDVKIERKGKKIIIKGIR